MPETLLKSQFETLEIPKYALAVSTALKPEEIETIIKKELLEKSEFGIIGLGVMGKSLSRNLARNGFRISMYNRQVKGSEEDVAVNFKKEHQELEHALAFDDLKHFVNSLQSPKKILLMVNAGKPVDSIIESLLPLLFENDIVIDGGNSHYQDTGRRIELLAKNKVSFIGCGISGGEEGALNGPSIMPGGDRSAYTAVSPFLESIAAKDKNDLPCCTYIGKGGSGHYVKMIHNGMEYAEMQLIAEVYSILKHTGKNPDEIAAVLDSWKSTVNSFLLEITIEILRYKENGDWLINSILDKAGNKGTGNWATIETTRLGVPGTLITSALFARYLSSFKSERMEMEKRYGKHEAALSLATDTLRKAYQLARIINHHQGFKILSEASKTYQWNLKLHEIARIWTNGCIIRSNLMEELVPLLWDTENILLHPKIVKEVDSLKASLRTIVSECILKEIPLPCLSDSINFLNGYMQANSAANIIQAQRDFFGAHTYQRIDEPNGNFYHTNWTD
ncbi:MAG: NADP-dependent phosphogluconate dehydrogenase [Flavobacteriaceae bacterium]|nr:NADP-dependent phosphogluconate dehydrogenase [Flavobacteriaceae bacterium]